VSKRKEWEVTVSTEIEKEETHSMREERAGEPVATLFAISASISHPLRARR